jgi:hypothetical protein
MKYSLPPVAAARPPTPLGPDVVLVSDKLFTRDPANLRTDEERALLALIDGKRTVAEILRVSPLSGFVAMRQLHSLSQRRIVRSVTSRPPTGPTPRVPSSRVSSRMGLTQDLTAAADAFVDGTIKVPETPPVRAVTTELVPVRTTVIATRPLGRQAMRTSPTLGSDASQAVDLWFKLIRKDWSTLAVVPGHKLGSGLTLASALAEVGSALTQRKVELFSGEGHDLVPTTDWIFPRRENDRFQRVIALDPIVSNPMVIPVAQAAQAVLIVVERGAADLGAVRRTVEAIGRHHITGCVMVSAPSL